MYPKLFLKQYNIDAKVNNEVQNLDYKNVVNITRSLLGLSCYEYFNDKTMNIESIVTEYNFN
jgi:transcription termination factor NusB